MRNILTLLFFLSAASTSHAQLNLFNPVPRSVNIDLANVKSPDYKARVKQYKDTIKSLGKLEKRTLVKAKRELKQLPMEDGHTVRLKNLERDVATYKSKIAEIDLARKAWQGRNTHRSQESDSSQSSGDKLKKLVKSKEADQLPWEEMGIDREVYLAEFETYDKYLEEGGGLKQGFQSDSASISRVDKVTQLTDQYFGSYENYLVCKEKITEVEGLMGQAKEYREGIEGILRGDPEQADQFVSALQARAMKITAMRDAAEELGELEGYEADIRQQIDEMRYKADLQSEYEKHLKGKDKNTLVNEALMKGKSMAGDHFEGHEDKLASAQKGLSQLKSGAFNFNSSKNMEIIKPNSLEGKSLGQRLVIGGHLQINRQEEHTGIDFSPHLGYRWNKKYLWGLGGTYRVKVNEDERSLLKGEQVYGGRFFMEYDISRFFLHGEYELISHAKVDPTTDKVSRIHAPGALLGVGINYNFMKHVKGNVMVLYNFLHDPLNSPYDKPVMLRFGFNLDK